MMIEVKAKGGSRSVFMIEVIEINKTSIFPSFIAIRLSILVVVLMCLHFVSFKYEHNEKFYLCFVIVVK
jgi:hypothetical protein